MRKINIPLAMIILTIFLSCGSDKELKKTSLTDNKWKLEELETGEIGNQVSDLNGDYTLRLYDNGKFKMKSDCNKCSGKYNAASRFIKFTQLKCSKKTCGKESYDYIFRTSIEKASSFRIYDKKLRLKSHNSTMIFSLE